MTDQLRLGEAVLPIGGVTHVMGVINLSPESRNRHTVAASPDEALELARAYREWGASIIDLGAQSSHYETPALPTDVVLRRLLPAVEALAGDDLLVAVDTWDPVVAAEALGRGAVMVNDTGGMTLAAMRAAVAARKAAAVVVYVEADNPLQVSGIDTTAGKASRTAEVLAPRLAELEAEGITEIVVDPGIAINYPGDYRAYTQMQLDVIRHADDLRTLGRPLLIPIPRKREDHRVSAYVTMAIENGADIIRVHDVEQACDLVALFDRRAEPIGAVS
ncbi:MAG TPA: dihydropteroate synthase [Acidimicrobiia bacterium]